MAEDQGGEEVIREIGKALALASELDPQIVRSLRSAIVQAMSDYEDDTNAQAAAALAAVLDFRPVTTQDALSQTLGEIGKLVQVSPDWRTFITLLRHQKVAEFAQSGHIYQLYHPSV